MAYIRDVNTIFTCQPYFTWGKKTHELFKKYMGQKTYNNYLSQNMWIFSHMWNFVLLLM